MRLGTIFGGKAWSSLNDAARDKRRSAEKRRSDEYERKRRRESLRAVAIMRDCPNQAWWGAE